METAKLKKFLQFARRNLREQVENRIHWVLAENSAAHRNSRDPQSETYRLLAD